MSRTDKTKPYWVKQNDKVLRKKYGSWDHDHLQRSSECIGEIEVEVPPHEEYRPVTNLSDFVTYYWIEGVGVVEKVWVTESRKTRKLYRMSSEVVECDVTSEHKRPVGHRYLSDEKHCEVSLRYWPKRSAKWRKVLRNTERRSLRAKERDQLQKERMYLKRGGSPSRFRETAWRSWDLGGMSYEERQNSWLFY